MTLIDPQMHVYEDVFNQIDRRADARFLAAQILSRLLPANLTNKILHEAFHEEICGHKLCGTQPLDMISHAELTCFRTNLLRTTAVNEAQPAAASSSNTNRKKRKLR